MSTWPEVERYLTHRRAIILPIGSTEQHGPTGLIGTDIITAQAIAEEVGQRTDTLVGPGIPVGMAHHHMAFPGSMTLRPSTLVQLLRDYVMSLSAHGFREVLVINGHGGNIASVTAAFYEIYEEMRLAGRDTTPPLRCELCNWFLMPAVAALQQELYGEREGLHATPSEVAVTQYIHPTRIKIAPLDPHPGTSSSFSDWRDFRTRFPDGRMGSDPSLATPRDGERFVQTAVAEIVARHGDFLNGV
nr:creatininase family protein [Roseospira visakhapatnamensis]